MASLETSDSCEIEDMHTDYDNFIPKTLGVLMQMGFPPTRAEKAIAATGDRGVQFASDWLLSHCDDPNIDEALPREYILYLCPVGPFQGQLSSFWQESLETCGWNGSHSNFLHITLCHFFTVPDSNVTALSEAVNKLSEKLKHAPGKLLLNFFSAVNFIGLFVGDVYYRFLTEVVNQFTDSLKKEGIHIEPPKKQLHMTLAYHYQVDHHEKLVAMAKEINLLSDVRWHLRLYSRDPKIGKSMVRKVIKCYKARTEHELDLIDGDFVYMDPEETQKGKNSHYHGTSWLTGNIGLFPIYYTHRTAEIWTWTLQRSLPLLEHVEKPQEAIVENGTAEETYEDLWRDEGAVLYAKAKKKKRESVVPQPVGPRSVYVMRHGERVDGVFGKQWIEKCFDQSGNYVRFDLNMPKTIHARKLNREHCSDTPLTPMGIVQAKVTGGALLDRGVTIQQVYTSPALRCIQTALAVVKTLQVSRPLRVELGLFEWLGWQRMGIPKWFTNRELSNLGYDIDVAYKSHFTTDMLNLSETVEDYYKRSGPLVEQILKNHEHEGGSVLIVGHAGSLDVCTRQLIGKPPIKPAGFNSLVCKVPYCGLCCIEEDPATKNWALKEPVIPAMTHGYLNPKNWYSELMSS